MNFNNILVIGIDTDTQKKIYSTTSSYSKSLYVVEKKNTAKNILIRRLKKRGVFSVINQLLFQVLIQRTHKYLCKDVSTYKKILIEDKIILGQSINSEDSIKKVRVLNPDLIVLAGCRILNKSFIESFSCPIINIHLGLTPKYRGVFGGVWPILMSDIDNIGVTLHHVNTGIDTGNIISQKKIKFNTKLNVQEVNNILLDEGLELLRNFINEPRNINNYNLTKGSLFYHPGITDFIKYYVKKNFNLCKSI